MLRFFWKKEIYFTFVHIYFHITNQNDKSNDLNQM